MKILYELVLLSEMLLVGYCGYKTLYKKDKVSKSICIVEWITFVILAFFILYTFSSSITMATLCKGLLLSLFDWLTFEILFYSQFYTGAFNGRKGVQLLMMAFSTIDTIMLVANTWIHNIFTVESIADEKIVITYINDSLWLKFHFAYTYLCIFLILLIYMYMIIQASHIYKQGYIVLAIVIAAGFIFDISNTSHSIYNISIGIYGLMSIMIYYLTFKYIPNELIENMLSLVVSDMENGLLCFDNKGRCVYCNELIKQIYNKTDHEDYTQLYQKWYIENDASRFDNITFEKEMKINDKKHHFEISYKRINDENAKLVCDYFVYVDRTQMYESLAREKYKATHDSLTGLLNREQFYVETAELLQKYPDTAFSILCSNIKDFKLVNDIFGIEKGNTVLLTQAKLMKNMESEKVICSRITNDRFAICMPQNDAIENKVRFIVDALKKEFAHNSFHMHMYMGIYNITDRNEAVSLMCDKANIAADTIKNNYEMCLARYDDYLLKASLDERQILGELDKALENEEFAMFLQPQIDSSLNVHGAEALVRWNHPTKGLLTPYAFVDIFENAGLIYKIDRYIWEKAAQKLSEWASKGKKDYYISVNISTKDFYILDIYEIFTELIRKYNIPASSINLEITETTLMSDFDKNSQILVRLQNAGFKIEIDDFGSGYSSLNMLKHINADVLKIDMEFLRSSENTERDREILKSMISLARKIGMDVITEGVETKAQLDMLTQMGCNNFQGYYFSKPIPAEEFEKNYVF